MLAMPGTCLSPPIHDMHHQQEFKIQNIVGSCDVKFPIRLEGLAMAHGYFATVRAVCVSG